MHREKNPNTNFNTENHPFSMENACCEFISSIFASISLVRYIQTYVLFHLETEWKRSKTKKDKNNEKKNLTQTFHFPRVMKEKQKNCDFLQIFFSSSLFGKVFLIRKYQLFAIHWYGSGLCVVVVVFNGILCSISIE